MKIEVLKLSDLTPMEKNIRKHNYVQVKELQKSFQKFGQIRPVVIDEKNVIIAGHGFVEAMKDLGETTVKAYRISDLSEAQKRKLMIADNKVYELGITDMSMLSENIDFINEHDVLDIPGFDEEVLKSLVSSVEEIDEEIKSYGDLSQGKVEELKSEGEKAQEKWEKPVEREIELDPEKISVEQRTPEDRPRPYTICESCGEKVWL